MSVRVMSPIGRRQARIAKRDGWRCRYCTHRLIPSDYSEGAVWIVRYDRGNGDGDGSGWVEAPGYRFAQTDHVIPRSRGGTDRFENLVLACLPCNSLKGARLLSELPDGWWQARHV